MIQAGERQELIIVKETGFGIYLAEHKESSEKVLLPKNEVDEGMKPGTKVEVFVYLDSSDRLIATRREPMVTIGRTAVLKVKDVDEDWRISGLGTGKGSAASVPRADRKSISGG